MPQSENQYVQDFAMPAGRGTKDGAVVSRAHLTLPDHPWVRLPVPIVRARAQRYRNPFTQMRF